MSHNYSDFEFYGLVSFFLVLNEFNPKLYSATLSPDEERITFCFYCKTDIYNISIAIDDDSDSCPVLEMDKVIVKRMLIGSQDVLKKCNDCQRPVLDDGSPIRKYDHCRMKPSGQEITIKCICSDHSEKEITERCQC